METTHSEVATGLSHNIKPFTHPENGDNQFGGSNEIIPLQPPSHPEDGDNPLRGNKEIVSQHITVFSHWRWRQPTQRLQQYCSTTYNHPLALEMVTTHSEAITILLYNIHPSIHPYAPQMGFFSLGGGNKTSPLLGFPPLGEVSYVLLLGFLPLGDGNADMPTSFSRSSYGSL